MKYGKGVLKKILFFYHAEKSICEKTWWKENVTKEILCIS